MIAGLHDCHNKIDLIKVPKNEKLVDRVVEG